MILFKYFLSLQIKKLKQPSICVCMFNSNQSLPRRIEKTWTAETKFKVWGYNSDGNELEDSPLPAFLDYAFA